MDQSRIANEILREALLRSGLTRAALATKIGVSRQAVDGWVNGALTVPVPRFAQCLEALGWGKRARGQAVLRVMGLAQDGEEEAA